MSSLWIQLRSQTRICRQSLWIKRIWIFSIKFLIKCAPERRFGTCCVAKKPKCGPESSYFCFLWFFQLWGNLSNFSVKLISSQDQCYVGSASQRFPTPCNFTSGQQCVSGLLKTQIAAGIYLPVCLCLCVPIFLTLTGIHRNLCLCLSCTISTSCRYRSYHKLNIM